MEAINNHVVDKTVTASIEMVVGEREQSPSMTTIDALIMG